MSEGTAVQVKEISLRDRALSELKAVDVGIADLKLKYANKKYDCTNTDEMAEAKADRLTIRTIRYQVPKIADEVTKQLNSVKKEVQTEGARIEAELLAIENVSHSAIQAEEARKEEIKAEKARQAAAEQKILDDKIIEISKLPLHCIQKSSEEIKSFLDVLESQDIAPHFPGESLLRAMTARKTAMDEIQQMLDVAIKMEELAAREAAERELEAVRQAELAKARAEEDRKLKEQADKLAAEQAEFRKQQEAFQKEQEAAREKQAEIDKAAAMERDRINAEARRQEQEAAEQVRLLAVQAEKERQIELAKALEAKKLADKKAKLAAAKCKDATTALKSILDLCNGTEVADLSVIDKIRDIAEANIL